MKPGKVTQNLLDSLLILALKNRRESLVKLLIDVHHASPFAEDAFGEKAVQFADEDLIPYLERCQKEETRQKKQKKR